MDRPRWSIILPTVFGFLCSMLSSQGLCQDGEKLKPPTKTDQAKALKVVQGIYEEEFKKRAVADRKALAEILLKQAEGFGYAIIESMACGRPVFLYRKFAKGKRYLGWSEEGRTAFFFGSQDEFDQKMRHWVEDAEFRHGVQADCAARIRELISNEDQAEILGSFLHNLR